MRLARIELALWIAVGVALVGGLLSWRRARPLPPMGDPASASAPAEVKLPDADSLAGAASRVIERDPFRIERRPAAVAFRPELEGAPPPPPLPPPKPALVLAGIIGGPPWEALLEGIPAQEGATLVRAGRVLGALRVRSVGRDTVVVQGMDTVWRLTLRRRWQ